MNDKTKHEHAADAMRYAFLNNKTKKNIMKNRTLGILMIATFLGSASTYYIGSYSTELNAFDMIGDVLMVAWFLSTIWGALRLIRS